MRAKPSAFSADWFQKVQEFHFCGLFAGFKAALIGVKQLMATRAAQFVDRLITVVVKEQLTLDKARFTLL